jgi:hypothetical protein
MLMAMMSAEKEFPKLIDHPSETSHAADDDDQYLA